MRKSGLCLSALLIGLSAALLNQTTWGHAFEEDWGLATLFELRGALPPPKEVVIIKIDRTSAQELKLDENPEKWSRSLYAQLLNKLNHYQPALIAFNIHFVEQRTLEEDNELAAAIESHHNVLLTSYIKQFKVQTAPTIKELNYERIIPPVTVLEKATVATAPFPIPRLLSTVKQFWTHKGSIGDMPTLPVAMFQFYLLQEAYDDILALLQKIDGNRFSKLPKSVAEFNLASKPLENFQEIEAALMQDSASLQHFDQLLQSSALAPEKKRLLHAWRYLMAGNSSLYLNYYGDLSAITTVPIHHVLSSEEINGDIFKHKIILIGYSTDLEDIDYNQGFYTVFSKNASVNTGSVDIAATAIANLVNASWIRPTPSNCQFILLVAWGLLLSGLFRVLPHNPAMILILLLGCVYIATAHYIFTTQQRWIPTIFPLIEIACVALFELLLHLKKIHAVSSFYVPQEVLKQNTLYLKAMNNYGELIHGVCMATDAKQYSALAEKMTATELNILMNKYYGAIFPAVRAHKGYICDVIGDAVLALWDKPISDQQLKINACLSALGVHDAIQGFNQTSPHLLPTRIGLHYGEMRLGNVGAEGHYEYRAVGDTVITATRIEGLNELLGTHILVSSIVLDNIPGFISREIGLFTLKGRTQALTIFELLDKDDKFDLRLNLLLSAFAHALQLFQSYQWPEAQKAFLEINQDYPNDGPTLFYLHYLQKQQNTLHVLSDPSTKPVIDARSLQVSWDYVYDSDNPSQQLRA